jgi:hypothetical protein
MNYQHLFSEAVNYGKLLLVVEFLPVDNVERPVKTTFNFFFIQKIPDQVGS